MDNLIIQSSKTEAILTFSNLTKNGFEISYQNNYVLARTKVFNMAESPTQIKNFFASMAQQKNGWNGEIAWTPYDETIKMLARVDRLGHVELKIAFWAFKLEAWDVIVTLQTELGQLERISQSVDKFFSSH